MEQIYAISSTFWSRKMIFILSMEMFHFVYEEGFFFVFVVEVRIIWTSTSIHVKHACDLHGKEKPLENYPIATVKRSICKWNFSILSISRTHTDTDGPRLQEDPSKLNETLFKMTMMIIVPT